jgi:hypothetical protein
MLRFILLMAAMFALPFILWHLWRLTAQPGQAEASAVPTGLLAIFGGVLAIGAVITLSLVDSPGTAREGRYQPPRVVDGQVQPGYFEPEEDPVPEDQPDDPPDLDRSPSRD